MNKIDFSNLKWEKLKYKLNPITRKDQRVIVRSMKFSWGLFAYEAVLGMIFLLAINAMFTRTTYGYSESYRNLVYMFPILAAVQFGIITLIVPIMTASAISGEKERQTFDILLTTTMSPRRIVYGKVQSSILQVLTFVVASIPLMAVSFTMGGLSWWNLLIVVIAFVVYALLVGSVGILASTLTKKTITSIIISYAIYYGLNQITVLPLIWTGVWAVGGGYTELIVFLCHFLLINPVAMVVVLIMMMMGGSAYQEIVGSSTVFLGLFSNGWLWLVVSMIALVALSFFLMEIAARRIDPVRNYGKKADKKAKKAAVNAQPAQGLAMQPVQGAPTAGVSEINQAMQSMTGQPIQGPAMQPAQSQPAVEPIVQPIQSTSMKEMPATEMILSEQPAAEAEVAETVMTDTAPASGNGNKQE